MLAGVVILFISGSFVFLYKETTQPNVPQKQTSICVALYAICMAMLSLATVIMLLALCRMKKNLPKGHQSKHGFNLRSCIVYSLLHLIYPKRVSLGSERYLLHFLAINCLSWYRCPMLLVLDTLEASRSYNRETICRACVHWCRLNRRLWWQSSKLISSFPPINSKIRKTQQQRDVEIWRRSFWSARRNFEKVQVQLHKSLKEIRNS